MKMESAAGGLIMEKIPGADMIHIGNGLDIGVVHGDTYFENKAKYVEIATNLWAEAMERDEEEQRKLIMENTAQETDSEFVRDRASFVFFLHGNKVVAGGMHRILEVASTREHGSISAVFGTRVVAEGYRGGKKGFHIGQCLTEFGVALAKKPEYLLWRGQSAISARSIDKAGLIVPGMHLPFDHTFAREDGDNEELYPDSKLKLMREVRDKLFHDIARDGQFVHWATSVSIGDLGRRNPNYDPEQDTHRSTVPYKRRMKTLGVDWERGDSVVALGELRP